MQPVKTSLELTTCFCRVGSCAILRLKTALRTKLRVARFRGEVVGAGPGDAVFEAELIAEAWAAGLHVAAPSRLPTVANWLAGTDQMSLPPWTCSHREEMIQTGRHVCP